MRLSGIPTGFLYCPLLLCSVTTWLGMDLEDASWATQFPIRTRSSDLIIIIPLKWISKSKNGCRSSAPLRILGSCRPPPINHSSMALSYYTWKTINLMSIINLLSRPHFCFWGASTFFLPTLLRLFPSLSSANEAMTPVLWSDEPNRDEMHSLC